jgi:neutral ceramidase
MWGCASVVGTIPAETPFVAQQALLGGAAKVDITPLPGYPLGGHAVAARFSRGYWIKLKARAVYLEDRFGVPLALVSTDLWSMPAGLGDRVAELLGQSQVCPVHRDAIILAATHTHQSPGNFATSPVYNALAQPGIGFDRHLFEFLASRIALSIEQACQAKEPVLLSLARDKIERLARNRSFDAFMRNPGAQALLDENAGLAEIEPHPLYAKSAYRAVDPALRVLRIAPVSAPESPIALAAFVAVHPTTLSHHTTVYSADLFGAAALMAEGELATTRSNPVVAIFNGAEGDVSPAWRDQTRADTVRLGRLLSSRIMEVAGKGEPVVGDITRSYALVRLADSCLDSNGKMCTDRDAVPGVALFGGTEDGMTEWVCRGWTEGVVGHVNDRQGAKQSALDLSFKFGIPLDFTRIAQRLLNAPKEAPVGVYQVGEFMLATLPGEFTTMMGRNVRDTILSKAGKRPRDLALVGLANEYISYVATPEEYEAQDYEGASTLFGPVSGPWIASKLAELSTKLAKSPARGEARQFDYRPGLAVEYNPADALTRHYEGVFANLEVDSETAKSIVGSVPEFCWSDKPLGMTGIAPNRPASPEVEIHGHVNGRWIQIETDGGPGVFVRLANTDDTEHRWCARWLDYGRKRSQYPEALFRITVRTMQGTEYRREPFGDADFARERGSQSPSLLPSCMR